MSAEKNLDPVHELEARLYGYMRIPIAGLRLGDGAPKQSRGGLGCGIERLRQAVWELGRDAAKIGKIPSGYPRHIDLVMRVISVLLPWYTRNLVQFGRQTTHTVQALAEAVEELGRRQDSLMAEFDRRREAGP